MEESRNWFAGRAVAAIVLIMLLVAGGFALHRLGWSQGYVAAELVAQGGEAPTPLLAPSGWRPVGVGRGGLLLISLIVGLILVAFVGKLLRVIIWGAMARPAMCHHAVGGSWRHKRHWMNAPGLPWYGPWYGQPGGGSEGSGDEANGEA